MRLYPKPTGECEWRLTVDPTLLRRYGAAVTSRSGTKTVCLA